MGGWVGYLAEREAVVHLVGERTKVHFAEELELNGLEEEGNGVGLEEREEDAGLVVGGGVHEEESGAHHIEIFSRSWVGGWVDGWVRWEGGWMGAVPVFSSTWIDSACSNVPCGWVGGWVGGWLGGWVDGLC